MKSFFTEQELADFMNDGFPANGNDWLLLLESPLDELVFESGHYFSEKPEKTHSVKEFDFQLVYQGDTASEDPTMGTGYHLESLIQVFLNKGLTTLQINRT